MRNVHCDTIYCYLLFVDDQRALTASSGVTLLTNCSFILETELFVANEHVSNGASFSHREHDLGISNKFFDFVVQTTYY